MQPVRANVMTIYSNHQTWNICVASQSTSTNYLYSNAGPSSTTLWVVQVSIGLNGGDNTQYANWGFIIDPNDHASYFGAAIEWETNGGEIYGSTLSTSLDTSMYLILGINNQDSRSQCYNVLVTAIYY